MRKNNFTRVAMTLFLALLFPLWGTVGQLCADPVTAEKARQQAKAFLNSRIASGSGPRHAPGVTPQLMQEQRVSGLYVFNVSNDGGFVIVSNDDIAEPILGYSDSGTIDPENMPTNMRAWLQGYADEIAWAKEHGITNVRPAKAPRHNTEASVKTPIEPLVKTTWDQGAPYNMYTPYYGIDSDGYYVYSTDQLPANITWSHCATGCVATAMAQVMKYHEWPAKPTKDIPGYNWSNYDSSISKIKKDTIEFNWTVMKNSYASSETGNSARAVALLMKYCGWSVEMDYGEESSSNTDKVATALKEYFDYKNTTTFVMRSDYSYAYWIELLYHELANGRPIVYGGQSSGGGHEFVCDGYQGEDYFHINWGWGGMSDNYFKLSALDPDAQGIGGSSSTDGFHYGQDAVIGIQKSTQNGTTLDVTPNSYNLSVNSITFNDHPTQGKEVEITVKIYNTGVYEYDGDIGCEIYYIDGDDWYFVDDVCKVFVISGESTKDCKLSFTPEYAGLYKVRPYRGGYYLGYDYYSITVETNESEEYSSNVELSISIDVDNSEATDGIKTYSDASTPIYTLYGNTLSATATLTNNTATNYKGTFAWILNPLGEYAYIKEIDVTVPANSSTQITFSEDELDYNKGYGLRARYLKGDAYTPWSRYGYYELQHPIFAYFTDGTKTLAKPNGTSYAAPDEALVIDVTGTGVTSITPNSQANAFYIYSGTKPEGLNGKNVIKYDDTYTAESITLTDDQPFYSPVNFTAGNISFAYQFTVGADGSNGWNTLCLPFNVSSVTANGTAIDWFRSVKDTGKNFWLKHFTSDESNKVYFDFADAIKANTPYIVAFPGDTWGSKWDMSNKEIKFIGENVTVSKGGKTPATTGNNYRFYGNTVPDATENIYGLNSDGNAFVLTNGSRPFRAYFKPGSFDRTVTSLAIASGTGVTTAIDSLPSTLLESEGAWFDLQGRQVVQPTKGLYIVNGKKVIVK